jgi:hypothetical protein
MYRRIRSEALGGEGKQRRRKRRAQSRIAMDAEKRENRAKVREAGKQPGIAANPGE